MAAGRPEAAAWAVDAANPGENLPPTGRSQFDRLFAASRGGKAGYELPAYDVPFPFAALLARIDAQLERDPASTLPPAKRVLIPLGRSLQRHAAAPDYFAFPRVVVAVDSPPAASSQLLLKDRLYIGYQEKSALLEVISYNEAAGRFEFQLVKNYRAGSRPQVVYANRTLCLACHQNGAAIFSRALWDETNANPRIAALLAARGKSFYGIAAQRGVDMPYAIDISVKRANGFALTQRLWQEGCGGADPAARRCRAALYTAALRRALADGRKAEAGVDSVDNKIAAALLPVSASRWPGGLAVRSADLPNRDPLPDPLNSAAGGRPAAHAAEVAARFDPLVPRPPELIWRSDAPEAIDALVDGLIEFISASDRQRLAAALAARPAPLVRLRLPCRTTRGTWRWSLSCQSAGDAQGAGLAATLATARGRFTGGQIDRLTLPDGSTLNGIALTASAPLAERRIALFPSARPGPRSALLRIGFDFRPGDEHGAAVAIDLRQEFPAVEQAIAELLTSADGEALFGPQPIAREALFAALLARLGAARSTICCRAAASLPPPQTASVAAESSTRGAPPAGAAAFYPYCAACHQGSETAPPNFLRGGADQVAAALRQCAPRLYVRLAMADLAPQQRAKTPMPPEALLPAFATDIDGWRASPLRAALLSEVGAWLRAESGLTPNLDILLAGGYEALRPCLPASSQPRRTP